jgi:hypothetical protein
MRLGPDANSHELAEYKALELIVDRRPVGIWPQEDMNEMDVVHRVFHM